MKNKLSKKHFAASIEELKSINVKVFFFHRIAMGKRKNYTHKAVMRMFREMSFPKIANSNGCLADEFDAITKHRYTKGDISKFADVPPIFCCNGRYIHKDYSNDNITVINGKRVVPNAPDEINSAIHIYGRCGAFGYAVKDEETMPSVLQRMINEDGYAVRVVNHGLWGASDDYIISNYLKDIREGIIEENDIVVFYMHKFESEYMDEAISNGMIFYDPTSEFYSYNNSKDCFYDKPGHMTAEGYKIVGDIEYEILKPHIVKVCSNNNKRVYLEKAISEFDYIENEIKEYVKDTIKIVGDINQGIIGCIVMNCNPFTLGHRYLIEYASSRVDKLVIFVLEEDKSEFSFEERYELVKKGVADIKNVVVVPSGKFIISSLTFPEYFIKGKNNDIEVDTSKDVDIFCNYIVPNFNIKIRFVGEEPLDKVTKQYNEKMQEMLPKRGVEFIVVPRKENESGSVISASSVRQLLKDKRFDDLKKVVPKTTYEYLISKKHKRIALKRSRVKHDSLISAKTVKRHIKRTINIVIKLYL